MAKLLNDFIAISKTIGMARNNRFEIQMALPNKLLSTIPQNISGNMKGILLFCDSISLPGVNISSAPNRSFGELRESPYERLYDNITCTFYVDSSLLVKSLFDEWVNVIQNTQNRTFSYYNDYITDATVYVQDIKANTRYSMKFFELYPKAISSIQLDYSNREVMKLSVQMAYRYWTKENYAVPPAIVNNSIFNVQLPTIFGGPIPNTDIPEGYFSNLDPYKQ